MEHPAKHSVYTGGLTTATSF